MVSQPFCISPFRKINYLDKGPMQRAYRDKYKVGEVCHNLLGWEIFENIHFFHFGLGVGNVKNSHFWAKSVLDWGFQGHI